MTSLHHWTQEEEFYLKEHYARTASEEMVRHLGLSWKKICRKAQYLGCVRDFSFIRTNYTEKKNDWKPEEDAFLRANYHVMDGDEISQRLGRKRDLIYSRAYFLRLPSSRTLDRWTAEEDDFLRQNYENMGKEALAASLNRDPQAVHSRLYRLNIKRTRRASPRTLLRESLMRAILGEIYPNERYIDDARPEWLINSETDRRMELDRYYPELRLAFEHNGVQHYKPFYKGSQKQQGTGRKEFKAQQRRDQAKKDLCTQQGITLITIKYTDRLSVANIKQLVERQTCQN